MKQMKKTIYTLIGIAIMLLGFFVPEGAVITQTGMRVLFIFIGTLFLWTAVGGPWVSVLSITMIGFSGYTETFGAAFTKALGDETILMTMFMFVLFAGGLAESGCMQYVTRWVLTRKFIAGKPYVMLAAIAICSYALAFVANQMVSAIIMIAVVAALCETVGIEHGKDKVWIYLFGMILLGAGIGQPGFVYKGIGLTMINVFTKVSEGAYVISPNGYMIYNVIMSMILIVTMLALIKFVFRPDMSKLKAVTVDVMKQASDLPPISKQQKCWLWVLVLFLVLAILPNIGSLGKLPIISTLKTINVIGISALFVVVLSIVKVDGEPMLQFQKAATKGIVWNVLFMVASGMMLGQAIGNADLGIITAIKQWLQPILADKPTLLVVFIIYLAALLITQFAVNLAMAIALMPIVVACSASLGLNPAPIALGVMMICFIAMMTPAASPLSAFCYGQDKYFSAKEIQSYAIPLSLIAVVIFTFIGYPLAAICVGI